MRLGNTRLGGEPDLPVGVDWPFVEDDGERRFANFVAQINFAELPRSIDDSSLPESEILYLFVRYMESASEPVVMDSIFYDGDMAALARRESPELQSDLHPEGFANAGDERENLYRQLVLAKKGKRRFIYNANRDFSNLVGEVTQG